jgi:OOP family OmpA-OmpF porin
MSPAIRWIVGIALALVAGALWMVWKAGDQPQTPAKAEAAKQQVAAAPAETTPAAAALAPVASIVPPAPKVVEPVTVIVHFDFDRSALRSGEVPKLDELASSLQGRTVERLDAVGYADRIGDEPYNLPLSRKRADAVVAYLAGKGVDAGRIHAEARGESEATTGDACRNMGPDSATNRKLVECLERDRRVEVKLVAR